MPLTLKIPLEFHLFLCKITFQPMYLLKVHLIEDLPYGLLLTRFALFLSIYAIISWTSLTIPLHFEVILAFSMKLSCSLLFFRIPVSFWNIQTWFCSVQTDFVPLLRQSGLMDVVWLFWSEDQANKPRSYSLEWSRAQFGPWFPQKYVCASVNVILWLNDGLV